MDNRKGDRHRNRSYRTRIFATGADKRRKAKEETRKAEEEAAKSRKISDFLTVQPRQAAPQRTSDTDDRSGTDANPPGPQVDDNDNTDANPKPSQAETDDTDANPPEADTEAAEGPPGIIPSGMREYWMIKWQLFNTAMKSSCHSTQCSSLGMTGQFNESAPVASSVDRTTMGKLCPGTGCASHLPKVVFSAFNVG